MAVFFLLFPSLLSPPFTTALTQSVIPAHSVFGFLHLALPPSTTFTIFHSLDSVGHSGPLSPWLPLNLFSLLLSLLLHHCLDSVGHSGPLGLWQPPLSFFLPPFSLFHHCLNPVGHSGPLGSWLPPSSCPQHLSWESILSRPQPSRSFRPTRLLASPRISHHLLIHFLVYLTSHSVIALSVIPAHTAVDFFSIMTTSSTKYPPDPETWMQITPTCQEIYDRSIPFPPPEPGYNTFPECMIDKAHLQIQHEWDPPLITNLMSALPHFDVPARIDDPSPLPWRVLWPYHPVIETFGQAKCPFFYLHDLVESDPAFAGIIPDDLDKNSDFIVVNPVTRVVIFHRVAQARHKCAIFLASRVEGELAPYFQSLWHRDENTPLPTTDPTFYSTIISTRLQQAYDILKGCGRPMHRTAWAEHRKKHYIESEEWHGTTVATRPPPPALSDPAAFPSMATAVNLPNTARSKLAPLPKKASSFTVAPSYAAEVPVSTLTASPSAPSAQSSALPLASPMPAAAPAPLQPAPPSVLFTGGMALPHDELMPQVTTAHLEQGGIPIDKGVKLTSLRVNSGAFQLPRSYLLFIKSLLKPFPAFHPFIPTWLASVRQAANFITTSSPAHLLQPLRWQPLMTLWVPILRLLPPRVGQTRPARPPITKSVFSPRWLTTALISLSPLRTLIDCLLRKSRDLKTHYSHSLFRLPHGLPLLVLSNTFMNNLTPTLTHNKRKECSTPL